MGLPLLFIIFDTIISPLCYLPDEACIFLTSVLKEEAMDEKIF